MSAEKHAKLHFGGVAAEGDITHKRAAIGDDGVGRCAGAGFVLDMGGHERVVCMTVLGPQSQATAEYAALLAGLRMAYLSRVTHLVAECTSAAVVEEMRMGTIAEARPAAIHEQCMGYVRRFVNVDFWQGSSNDTVAAINHADESAMKGYDMLMGYEQGIDGNQFLAAALLPQPKGLSVSEDGQTYTMRFK